MMLNPYFRKEWSQQASREDEHISRSSSETGRGDWINSRQDGQISWAVTAYTCYIQSEVQSRRSEAP